MAFKANNKQGTVTNYISRLSFKVNATSEVEWRAARFGKSNYSKTLKDFRFGERITYGKMDTGMNPVILDADNNADMMKKVGMSDSHGLIMAVDFVADAYADFSRYFQTAARNGKIDRTDPVLGEPIAMKGYFPFESLKKTVRARVYYKQFLGYLTELEKKNLTDIRDFPTFMNYFIEYARITAPEHPFTKGEMLKNKFVPLLTSGLVIEIGDGDFSNDEPIYELFYNSRNFDYYLNVAMKTGFSVDKNAPWRLVADLGSPAMQRYMAPYGVQSPGSFFAQYTRDASEYDYQEFIDFVLRTYHDFVVTKNLKSTPRECKSLVLTIRNNLQTLNEIDVYQLFGADFFIRHYILLKNGENGELLDTHEIKRLTNKLDDILLLNLPKREKYDRIASMIESKFKGLRGRGTVTSIKKVNRARTRASKK